MANIYTWSIQQLECVPSLDGLTNVVKFVIWRLHAGSQDGRFGAVNQGKLEVGEPSPSNFTPYNDLTEQEVIAWVQGTLGQQAINAMIAALDQQIDDQENPKIITKPLPW